MKKILTTFRQDFKHHRQSFLLLGLLIAFFILRFPSFFEPHWYGDEGIYQVVAKSLQEGRVLYQEIWDNKPPVLYLIYAFFNADLFLVKLASTIVGVGSVLAFFFLAKAFIDSSKIVYFSTALFATLFGLPLLEGNIANAENFMLLPLILSSYFILSRRHFLASGLLLSIAFLTKTIAVFDVAALLTFLAFAYTWKRENISKTVRQFSLHIRPIVMGFSLPILLTLLIFWGSGILPDFIQATFLQGVDYVSTGNSFFFPQGLLLIKLLLLGSFVILMYLYRKTFTKFQIFILLWLAFSLFNAFFAQRPYTHYLLVLLPSFCLLVGEILNTKKFRFTGILFMLFVLAITLKSFWIYGNTLSYYQNFLQFVTSSKSPEKYYAFFDQATVKDYEAAEFIRMHTGPNDKVFVWGNSAQVYILSGKLPPGRISVAYHITFYKEALDESLKVLDRVKPKYIIVLSPLDRYEDIVKHYSLSFTLSKGATVYERTH